MWTCTLENSNFHFVINTTISFSTGHAWEKKVIMIFIFYYWHNCKEAKIENNVPPFFLRIGCMYGYGKSCVQNYVLFKNYFYLFIYLFPPVLFFPIKQSFKNDDCEFCIVIDLTRFTKSYKRQSKIKLIKAAYVYTCMFLKNSI